MAEDERTMDEMDIKERIIAEPGEDIDLSGLDDDERRDAERLQAEMRALDANIAKALDVPLPTLRMPELPPVEDDNVVDIAARHKRSASPVRWLALAASVALIAVFGAQFLQSPEYPSLADEVVAHLDHEPDAFRVTNVAVEERRLASVVNSNGADLDRGVGLITYAKSCVINGKEVPHLVMQGESGPVTLLLMPNERVDSAVPLSGKSIRGVILPVGDGSIAIIGESEENLAEIEERVVDSVTWTT